MRFFKIVFTFLIFFSYLHAENFNPVTTELKQLKDPKLIPNEILMLDSLIEATEDSLKQQKILKGQLINYKEAMATFLKNSDDNDLLYKVVKAAFIAHQTIVENHLTDNFNPEFISELSFFSQYANKNTIPHP
jgi:hypothetical protein